MDKRLSFAYVNKIENNIAEIIIDNNVIITLEMIEEYDRYLKEQFTGKFAVLINRINHYSYSFEAKLTIGSIEGLSAIAVVYYNRMSKESSEAIMNARVNDNFNLKLFSGLELGKKLGLDWLKSELSKEQEQ